MTSSGETTKTSRPAPTGSDRLRITTDKITRPPHIPPTWDPRYMSISDRAVDLLATYTEHEPTPDQARILLPRWTAACADYLHESSRSDLLVSHLQAASPDLLDGMDTWLRGHWSTRDSLVELCWRCGLGQRSVGVVLWLHDRGAP